MMNSDEVGTIFCTLLTERVIGPYAPLVRVPKH